MTVINLVIQNTSGGKANIFHLIQNTHDNIASIFLMIQNTLDK